MTGCLGTWCVVVVGRQVCRCRQGLMARRRSLSAVLVCASVEVGFMSCRVGASL